MAMQELILNAAPTLYPSVEVAWLGDSFQGKLALAIPTTRLIPVCFFREKTKSRLSFLHTFPFIVLFVVQIPMISGGVVLHSPKIFPRGGRPIRRWLIREEGLSFEERALVEEKRR